EMRVGVVVVQRGTRTRTRGARCALLAVLREHIRSGVEVPQGSCDASDELAARNTHAGLRSNSENFSSLRSAPRTFVFIPPDTTPGAGTYQIWTSVAVDVGSYTSVHGEFVFDSLVLPDARRRVGGGVKHVNAWGGLRALRCGAAVVVRDDVVAAVAVQ